MLNAGVEPPPLHSLDIICDAGLVGLSLTNRVDRGVWRWSGTGNGCRFLIALNRMWECKLLTWDARAAGGLGRSPAVRGGWGEGDGCSERARHVFLCTS